ncbi:MAG: hypothetical protein CSA42_07925 [Gammaproteobacteria bacterium]|nr:MAG: hypothetical protein CSA42_07925 [Gammaproteobacteria bacterium]
MKITAIFLVFLCFALWLFLRKMFQRMIIYDYECGLLYKEGKFLRQINAGIYWYNMYQTKIEKIDLRKFYITVPAQEILTKDGVTIKITLSVNVKISDPLIAINSTKNYQDALYLVLQLALRKIVGETEIEDLLKKRQEIGKEIFSLSQKDVNKYGLELLTVNIKDVTFPGSLKQIFSEVVKARQEGLAALERARGETAALRKLANTAKMLENNPTLMQLRMLQTMNEKSGNTLIFNMSQNEVIPVKKVEKPGC